MVVQGSQVILAGIRRFVIQIHCYSLETKIDGTQAPLQWDWVFMGDCLKCGWSEVDPTDTESCAVITDQGVCDRVLYMSREE